MNKNKNDEIKGFLEWVEGKIGAEIDDLQLKTKIKGSYRYDFDGLLIILKKNKKKITVNIIEQRDSGEFEGEFEVSMGRLRPLTERIEKTDRLIDQVVYWLYGLSEDEVRVVEGG